MKTDLYPDGEISVSLRGIMTAGLLLFLLSACTGPAPAPIPLHPESGKQARSGISGTAETGDARSRDRNFSFLDVDDPFEPMNRGIYSFNILADDYVMEPAVRWYEKLIPGMIRNRISDFFDNIGDIPVMLNCFLQGKPEKGGTVLGRIMINTTVGICGLWDPASAIENLPEYAEDFGQTLGVWGLPAGPYLMLPLLGPSSVRDAAGTLVDGAGSSMGVTALEIPEFTDLSLSAVKSLEYRASLPFAYGDFDSPFEYEMVRLLYHRMREMQVNDGAAGTSSGH